MKSASLMAIFPIGGMLAGLLLSALRGRQLIPDDLFRLARMVRWGVVGFFMGCAFALLVVLFRTRRLSVKGLMGLVAITAVVFWWIVSILFAALGN